MTNPDANTDLWRLTNLLLSAVAQNIVDEAHEAVEQLEDAGVDVAVPLGLLWEIFGDGLGPIPFDPAWRTEAAVGIARGVYDDRAFDRLPILADALQDAGCADADLLAHCRGPGPHVRGCWVVDAVLGKE